MSGGLAGAAGQSYRMDVDKGEGEGDLEDRPANGYKTALCRYFAQGKCFKGSRCLFAHGPRELVRVGAKPAAASAAYTPLSLKPSTLVINHASPTSAAAAATGPKTHLYRTQMCGFWLEGHCARGASCTFAHGERELRPMGPPSKPTFGEVVTKQLNVWSDHPSKPPTSPVVKPSQHATASTPFTPPKPSYATTSKTYIENYANSSNQSYSHIATRSTASAPVVPRPLPVAKDKMKTNINDVTYDAVTRPPYYNPHFESLQGFGRDVTLPGFQDVQSKQTGYDRKAPITSLAEYNKLLGLH